MDNNNEREWEFRCSKEKYSSLRSSHQFKCMVTLGRIMNSINCALAPVAHYGPDDSSPEKQRQVLGSMMNLGAVLYEALLFTERQLTRQFRHNTTFETGLGAMLRDKSVSQLRANRLGTLRNKIVFHFDHPAVDQGVDSIDVDYVVFLRGIGQDTHSLYFQFADEATMHYLLGCPKSKVEFDVQSKEFISSLTEASRKFVRHSGALIVEVLSRLGFEHEKKNV